MVDPIPPPGGGGGPEPPTATTSDVRTQGQTVIQGDWRASKVRTNVGGAGAGSTVLITEEPCFFIKGEVVNQNANPTEVKWSSPADASTPASGQDLVWVIRTPGSDSRSTPDIIAGRYCPGGLAFEVTSGLAAAAVNTAYVLLHESEIYRIEKAALRGQNSENTVAYGASKGKTRPASAQSEPARRYPRRVR